MTDEQDLSSAGDRTIAGGVGGACIGKFPVTRKLGKGAMGEVWLGHHPDLNVPVAIKVLAPHLAMKDPDYIERFIKEAHTAARISHHNVVRIFDAGTDGDIHYLVMEFVPGGSVKDLLDENSGGLEVSRALDIVIGVAAGLKAAAAFGVIHRDVKPDNIMIAKDGSPKIADLGLAKQAEGFGGSGVTATGVAVGTPSYISPEQAHDAKTVDSRSDVYSLGATFYHLVTGELPFTGSSAFNIMMKHVNEPLPHPKTWRKDLPENVCAVICKMMEKTPDDRYQSMAEVLSELQKVRYRDAPVEELLASSVTDSVVMSAVPYAGSPSRSRRAGPLVFLFLILVVPATMFFGFRRWKGDSRWWPFAREHFVGREDGRQQPDGAKSVGFADQLAWQQPRDEAPESSEPGRAREEGTAQSRESTSPPGENQLPVSEEVSPGGAEEAPSESLDAELPPAGRDTVSTVAEEVGGLTEEETAAVDADAAEIESGSVSDRLVDESEEVSVGPGEKVSLLPGDTGRTQQSERVEEPVMAAREKPGKLELTEGGKRGSPVSPARAQPQVGRDWSVPELGMEFVWLEALDCWAGRYEVTNGEYRAFNPGHSSGRYEERSLDADRQPVVEVSFLEAVAFSRWLTEREQKAGRLPENYGYRLPTGNEWMVYARCGTDRIYPWGDQWPPTVGNYSDTRARDALGGAAIDGYDDGHSVSSAVEESGMNEWDLAGIGGNVWEWTAEEDTCVARGGSWWDNFADYLKCSYRDKCPPANTQNYLGFRLVLALDR